MLLGSRKQDSKQRGQKILGRFSTNKQPIPPTYTILEDPKTKDFLAAQQIYISHLKKYSAMVRV